jgi:hypothetical protein
MKLFRAIVTALLSCGLLLVVGTAPADDIKADPSPTPELSEKEKQAIQDVEDLTTAFRLIEMGEKQSAPEMLLSAAFLMRKLAHSTMQQIKDQPTVEGSGSGDKPPTDEAKPLNYEAESDKLIERAREIAAEKKLNLEPLISDLKKREIERLVVGGPRNVCRVIAVKQVHVYQIEVEEIKQFTWSYRSTSTVKVEILRSDTGHVHASHSHTSGGGVVQPGKSSVKTKTVVMTVRITNISEKVCQYQVWTN